MVEVWGPGFDMFLLLVPLKNMLCFDFLSVLFLIGFSNIQGCQNI